ncbi:DNA (cytosine-5-)-methyltransferase [bacterium]|nr:DNA (cytosine-5-)-methyltransferase [bacterium]
MNYLSVCSGIEAATVAWEPLGFKPLGFSEIEEFPCAVLRHHYPEVPNFGDMTQFQGWNINEAIDILAGGTPCQSFSIAGLRKGLDDPRGNLCLTYIAIAAKFKPRWIVWENVPGVLSSNGGRDFGSFLGALEKCGYGWSYRVLDAQWFGVAQRRRRVFVVANLGSWQRSAAVLFERKSLQRNTPPSREAGERIAATAAGSAGKRGKECLNGEGSSMLPSANHANVAGNSIVSNANNTTPIVNAQDQRKTSLNTKLKKESYTQDSEAIKEIKKDNRHDNQLNRLVSFGEYKNDGTASSLKTRDYKDATDLVLEDQGGSVINVRTDGTVGTLRRETHGHEPAEVTYGIPGNWIGRKPENGGNAVEPMHDLAPCLTKTDKHGVAYGFEPGIAKREGDPQRFVKEMTPTLRRTMGDNQVSAVIVHGTQDPCISNIAFSQGRNNGGENVLIRPMAFRRLTPIECERLQGFPDNYTLISYRKKPAEQCPDSPRYKALGNSMAVPVMRWIGERIAMVEAIAKNG